MGGDSLIAAQINVLAFISFQIEFEKLRVKILKVTLYR